MATVLVNGGEQWVCDKLDGVVSTVGNFVGWGTGVGTAAKADTTLFTEAAETRVSTNSPTTSGTGSAAKWQLIQTITSASAQTITNAGNFTAVSAGTLIVHGDFTGIPLAINDAIQFTITMDPS